MLHSDNHSALAIPGVGGIPKLTKEALFLPASHIATLGGLYPRHPQPIQAWVFGYPHEVIHPLALTPSKHPRTTKAAVRPKDNSHLGPDLPKALDQQCQNRPSVFGSIDVAGTQITHQQLIPTKHIQGQKTVTVIIAVKKSPLLVPVERVI